MGIWDTWCQAGAADGHVGSPCYPFVSCTAADACWQRLMLQCPSHPEARIGVQSATVSLTLLDWKQRLFCCWLCISLYWMTCPTSQHLQSARVSTCRQSCRIFLVCCVNMQPRLLLRLYTRTYNAVSTYFY